ncbi:hypothetical protein GDO86_000339 [Hymenochirus boettgeri]|uniref:Uncharacterized protein n=1 Tax=Hymenochirus boettgeri TaxID=247094 RepID=A0A8T2KCT6_9PIPI|nr:hypothetical protein GDO86_000339 [Hymenochirus boettgeri]
MYCASLTCKCILSHSIKAVTKHFYFFFISQDEAEKEHSRGRNTALRKVKGITLTEYVKYSRSYENDLGQSKPGQRHLRTCAFNPKFFTALDLEQHL